jgi:hypothetical protein
MDCLYLYRVQEKIGPGKPVVAQGKKGTIEEHGRLTAMRLRKGSAMGKESQSRPQA